MFRKLIVAGALVAVLLAAGLGAVAFKLNSEIESGKLAERISTLVQEKTGRKVALGTIRIAGPLSAEVENFRLMPAQPGGSEIALKAVRARLSFDSLMQGRVVLSSLTLVGPSIDLIRRADGSTNLAETLGQPSRSEGSRAGVSPVLAREAGQPDGSAETAVPAAGTPVAQASQPAATDLSSMPFRSVAIEKGSFTYRDETWPEGKRLAVSDVEGSIAFPPAGQKALAVKLEASLGQGELALDAKLDPGTVSGQVKLTASGVDLAGFESFFPAAPVKLARMPLDASLTAALEAGALASLEGEATIENGELTVSAQGLRVTEINGKLDASRDLVEIPSLMAKIAGSIPLTFSGKVADPAGQRILDLVLDIPRTDLTQLAESGLAKVPEGASGSVTGRLTVKGPAAAPAIEGRLVPDGLTWPVAVGAIGVPVKVSRGELEVTTGQARTDGLVLEVGGQPVQVSLTVEDYLAVPSWKAEVKAEALDVKSLLALAPPETREAAAAYSPSGRVSIDVTASGSGGTHRFQGHAIPQGLAAQLVVGEAHLPVKVKSGKIVFDADAARSEGLVLDIAGSEATVAVKVSPLLGERVVEATAKLASMNVARALELLPAGQREKLAGYGLAGSVSAQVSANVAGGATKLGGEVDVGNLTAQVSHAGQPVMLAMRTGKLRLQGQEIALEGVSAGLKLGKGEGKASDGLITLGGVVRIAADPVSMALTLKGEQIRLAALSAFLPELPVRLEGTAGLSGTIQGTPAAPLVDVGLEVGGIVAHHPALGLPLKGNSGRVLYRGKDAIFEDVRLGIGSSEIALTGRLADAAGAGDFQNLTLDGRIDLSDAPKVAALPGRMEMAGKGTIKGVVKGNKSAAQLEGEGRFSNAAVVLASETGAKSRFDFSNLLASFRAKPGQFLIDPIEAGLSGGQLRGKLQGAPEEAVTAELQIRDADMGAMLAGMRNLPPGAVSGRIDTNVNVSLPPGQGAAGMSGAGEANIRGLQVNGKELVKMSPHWSKVKTVKTLGKIGMIAGALAGENTVAGQFGAETAAINEKYSPMFDFAGSNHEFGDLKYAFQIAGGIATGELRTEGGRGSITGPLRVDLTAGTASGQFDLVTSDGSQTLHVSNILFDNSATVPMQTRNGLQDFHYTGQGREITGSQVLAEPAQQQPTEKEQIVDTVRGLFGGGSSRPDPGTGEQQPTPPSREDQAAGILKGLLGGGKQQEQAPEPAPEEAQAQPAAPEEPAAEPASPAPTPPAEQPSERDEAVNVLKGLFGR